MSKRDHEQREDKQQEKPVDKAPEKAEDKAQEKAPEKAQEKAPEKPKSGNQEQSEFWNGASGDRWVAYQDQMDQNLRPLGDAALQAARVLRGERVLDVGCGCGETTLQIADYVGEDGQVTGVDISKPMLARAKERAEGRTNIELVETDASTATGATFDLVYSRFGVMFFADPKAAFQQLASRLDDGGRIAFVAWRSPQENEWVRVVMDAIDPVIPPDPNANPDAPGPFAFANAEKIEGILKAAGFKDIRIQAVDKNISWTRSRDVANGADFLSKMGPSSRRFADVADDVRTQAIAAMRDALRPFQTQRGLVLGAAVWVVTAKK